MHAVSDAKTLNEIRIKIIYTFLSSEILKTHYEPHLQSFHISSLRVDSAVSDDVALQCHGARATPSDVWGHCSCWGVCISSYCRLYEDSSPCDSSVTICHECLIFHNAKNLNLNAGIGIRKTFTLHEMGNSVKTFQAVLCRAVIKLSSWRSHAAIF